MKKLLLIFFIFISGKVLSQVNSRYEVITYSGVPVNTWTILPQNYDPSKKYGIIVYVPGSGELATGTFSTDSSRIYTYGPTRARKLATWDGKITFKHINGTSVDTPVIVLGIQPYGPSAVTSRSVLSRITDSILKRYSVDTMRMIATGLSMGGQMINQALMISTNGTSPTISYEHYTRWSGALIFSTPYPTSGGSVSNLGLWLDKTGGIYLYGVGSADPNTTIEPSDLATFQTQFPGQVYANLYPGEGHGSWNTRYNNPAIYDTMGFADKYPKAFAQTLINVNYPFQTSITLNGQSRGYNKQIQWTKLSGPSGGTLSAPTSDTTNASSLVPGTYQFRLTVTNGTSVSSESHTVTVIVASGGEGYPKRPGTGRWKLN